MTRTYSLPSFRLLSLAILAALPLFASAQTLGGFSAPAPSSPSGEVAESKFRTVDKPSAGRYIVVLNSTAARLANETTSGDKAKLPSIAKLADEMATTYGVDLTQTYQYVLRGFAITADEKALAQLLADPRVDYVQEDGIVSLSAVQPNATWGLDRIDQRNLPLRPSSPGSPTT